MWTKLSHPSIKQKNLTETEIEKFDIHAVQTTLVAYNG